MRPWLRDALVSQVRRHRTMTGGDTGTWRFQRPTPHDARPGLSLVCVAGWQWRVLLLTAARVRGSSVRNVLYIQY
jgi:hypothetical protein